MNIETTEKCPVCGNHKIIQKEYCEECYEYQEHIQNMRKFNRRKKYFDSEG